MLEQVFGSPDWPAPSQWATKPIAQSYWTPAQPPNRPAWTSRGASRRCAQKQEWPGFAHRGCSGQYPSLSPPLREPLASCRKPHRAAQRCPAKWLPARQDSPPAPPGPLGERVRAPFADDPHKLPYPLAGPAWRPHRLLCRPPTPFHAPWRWRRLSKKPARSLPCAWLDRPASVKSTGLRRNGRPRAAEGQCRQSRHSYTTQRCLDRGAALAEKNWPLVRNLRGGNIPKPNSFWRCRRVDKARPISYSFEWPSE